MTVDAPSTFRDSVRTLLRDRLLDAAASITATDGWGAVTMAKLADEVGVSRQTVYNELGSKPRIAEALVMRELDRFLDIVRTKLSSEHDLVDALRSACEGALEEAAANPLLKAVLDSAHTGGSDLLPLLTTQSQGLIEGATVVVIDSLEEQRFETGLDEAELRTAVDAIIRLVLSHVMQPAKTPSEAAADIAWVAGHVLHDVTHNGG
ncbi:MAG TPA: TetR family transcriptional regulator [Nocardioidaceae bacterium]|nr:TetR family transcriptional regulator [Nocardioidaceae bacterium]